MISIVPWQIIRFSDGTTLTSRTTERVTKRFLDSISRRDFEAAASFVSFLGFTETDRPIDDQMLGVSATKERDLLVDSQSFSVVMYNFLHTEMFAFVPMTLLREEKLL